MQKAYERQADLQGQQASPGDFIGSVDLDRLAFRRLRESDLLEIADFISDWDVAKQTAAIPHPFTSSHAQNWFDYVQDAWAHGREYVLVVERCSDQKVVGAVGVRVDRRLWGRVGSVGYWIGKPHWGKGYATEAVEGFLQFCARDLRLKRLCAEVFDDNERSLRVLEKCGFEPQKLRKVNYADRGGKRKIWILRHRSQGAGS